jgi:Flp pilus assembly pilin Flp
MRPPSTLRAAWRDFARAESGGATVEYVIFTVCWALAVSSGLYAMNATLSARFAGVVTALERGGSTLTGTHR